MARIIVIGGIESTYHNVQALHDLGEEIVMFYTRGPSSPGWEGVDQVDESRFPFADNVPKTIVDGHINDHVDEMQSLRPDVIYSLGWQQMYSKKLLAITKVVGIHESLLPEGAGAVPIANAVLHGVKRTGCTLFWLDGERIREASLVNWLAYLILGWRIQRSYMKKRFTWVSICSKCLCLTSTAEEPRRFLKI